MATSRNDLVDAYSYVRDRESRARTYANAVDRVLRYGHLARIRDTEDREYLDCLSVAGTLALGHNHPAVLAKVQEYLASGQIQQALDLTTPAKYEFLRVLYDTLPPAFAANAKVQFCGPSGADAAEAAIKLFKTATGRRTVVAFRGAYHGMTTGSLSLMGNVAPKQRVASLMPDVHFLPYPYSYRCPFGIGGDEGMRVGLRYIERMFDDPESGITTPAAVVLEAIQGEGGVVPAPAEWLRGIREITAARDIPLVVDEIQTGFGRTGTMFAFEDAGITPDAVLLSKAVGGGYPLALVLYHAKYDTWEPGAHAGTFRGNQLAMVAGAATMVVIRAENLVEQARAKGELIRELLTQLAADRPEIGEVRGRGLMWGLEIVDPQGPTDVLGSRPGDGARTRALKRRCLEIGLLVESGGRHGAVLRLLPPLVITEPEIVEMAEKLEKAFIDCAFHQVEGLVIDESTQWRVEFNAEVEFSNGGALQAQEFRLDVPGADISDDAIGELFVRHLGLLMVGKTVITNRKLINEPHKGSRGVDTGQRRRTVVDLSPQDGVALTTGSTDLAAVLVRLLGSGSARVEVPALVPFDVTGAAVLLHTGGPATLTGQAAEWLVEQGAALVGTDAAEAGPAGELLARAGVPVLAGLRDLDRLPPTGVWLLAVPVAAGTARLYGIADDR